MMDLTILRFDTVDSTNTVAADHARRGAGEGLCIIAREQTSGRGRYGREWISTRDAGLYLSIILRPRLGARDLPLVTLAAGVAVHASLADIGIAADIKWVNDLLVDEKKIAGILAEAIDTTDGTAVILGIGINLTADAFPVTIAATSIEATAPAMVKADELAAVLTGNVATYYEMLCVPGGPASIIDEWHKRSSWFRGKHVRVSLPDSSLEGITDGLEENGALRLTTIDGETKIVQAGDVERVRPARA